MAPEIIQNPPNLTLQKPLLYDCKKLVSIEGKWGEWLKEAVILQGTCLSPPIPLRCK